MSTTIAFLGMPYEFALVAITVIATIITGLAMLAIVFFAWAPHLSNAWASEFGVGFPQFEEDTPAGGD